VKVGVDRMHLRLGQPLLAVRARPWIGALLTCCAILVAWFGLLFAHDARPDRLDQAVDSPIIALFANHEGLAFRLAFPGTVVPAVLVSAVIIAICLLTGRLNGAVLAAAAVPVAVGLDEVFLKPLVDRTYGGQLTFPSGHTTAVFALAATVTVLLLVSPQPVSRRAVRVIAPVAAGAVGVIVAIAVIGLRWHYFTDTVAGAAVGVGTVCGLALVLDLP
jgi:membrane-associated phospholipid phosphatase